LGQETAECRNHAIEADWSSLAVAVVRFVDLPAESLCSSSSGLVDEVSRSLHSLLLLFPMVPRKDFNPLLLLGKLVEVITFRHLPR
jgi:hypothetical protein